ncbi:MAG: hypothetical protein SAK29_30015 [Scytonema sp. PMC 1069.18]|nr:hypothetical protein [Scytonema sp. PMC 1069.18]MEC4887298.1 hypothetical protein [Scytonema sp. PMC 1070.18]
MSVNLLQEQDKITILNVWSPGLIESNEPVVKSTTIPSQTNTNRFVERREEIKQELRQRIQETLECVKDLSAEDGRNEIRNRLFAIQEYCKTVGKTFLFFEQRINCEQFGLEGSQEDFAILFRGPSEDASVAICITDKGSLLYRNDSPWRIYKNFRDVFSRQF